MIWFWIFSYAIAFGTVTSLAAKSKGRDPFSWFLIGFVFGVFGLVAVLVMESMENEGRDSRYENAPTSSVSPKTKKCPDCAEEIKLEARVCRFCGKRFTKEEVANHLLVELPQAPKAEISGQHRIRDVRCPHCYTMNYDTDYVCSSCGKGL